MSDGDGHHDRPHRHHEHPHGPERVEGSWADPGDDRPLSTAPRQLLTGPGMATGAALGSGARTVIRRGGDVEVGVL